MEVYKGKGVSTGIVTGDIYLYQGSKPAVWKTYIEDSRSELARYTTAKNKAMTELEELYQKAVKAVGEEQAAIFEVHQMMLEDENYNKAIENLIRNEHVNAEYAVSQTGAYYARVFAEMEDSYIKERAADMEDVSNRIIGILKEGEGASSSDKGDSEHADSTQESGKRNGALVTDTPVIIVAEDLAPSQTVQFEREKVLAFVTKRGSATSHTAILAKTMGIPAIVGADISLDELAYTESKLERKIKGAVDGAGGLFYVEPDEETLRELAAKKEMQQGESELCRQFIGKETITLDGRRLALCANVGNLKDVELAIQNDAEGIGLFRSEFLYLEREDYPSEEEQFQIYRQVLEKMKGKPVIIRTLDIGADKQSSYMELPKEKNPALGCRGIRICLKRPEIFKIQLRALFRAAAFGRLQIMYPMITGLDEICRVKELVKQIKTELEASGILYEEPKQGVMIETPAAALISEELAKEVDFFSIGTNDLTQYTLAMDRENEDLEAFYDAHHPAILRLIAMTVQGAHKAGIPVGICGELAGDHTLLEEWVRLGVDELSVAPGKVLPLRRMICNLKRD